MRRAKSRPPITVDDYAQRWLKTPSAKPSTHVRNVHYRALENWILPTLGRQNLQTLTTSHLIDLQQRLLAEGLKLSSVKTAITSTFGSLWAHAKSEGLVKGSPLTELRWPRILHEPPDPFTEPERNQILHWLKRHRPVYLPYVLFIFFSGARPGEAAGLQWWDFDQEERRISIVRGLVALEVRPTKTGRARRTIPLEPEAHEAIRMSPRRGPYIFTGKAGEPYNTCSTLQHTWRYVCAQTGIRHRKIYAMRHTFVSLALSAGAPAQEVAEYCGTSLVMLQYHYARWLGQTRVGPLSAAKMRNASSAPKEPSRQLQLFES